MEAEKENIQSSGSLIAGLREMMGGPDAALHAYFAGKDGQEQAQYMVALFPYMADCIRARQIHKVQFLSDWDGQIVVVACGLDPLSEYLPRPDRLFMLDLPPMLKRHQQALESWNKSKGTATKLPHFVPCDLSATSVIDALRSCPQFDPQRPARVVVEGLSVYFEAGQLRKLIQGIEPLIRKGNGQGGVWMDIVSEAALKVQAGWKSQRPEPENPDNWRDVIESKGEHLVFGHDDPVALARSDWGFHDLDVSVESAENVVSKSFGPNGQYYFLTIRDVEKGLRP